MDPESEDLSVKSPVSSPPSTEGPDYISSYTQISQYNNNSNSDNNVTIGDHTDIESDSDNELKDDNDNDDQKNQSNSMKKDSAKNETSKLSSQIIEWSKKRFESYNDDNTGEQNQDQIDEELESESVEQPQEQISSTSTDLDVVEQSTTIADAEEKLKFFQKKFIIDIEKQALIIERNMQQIMTYLTSYSSNVTSSSVNVMEIYHDNIFDTCDHIDSNIKLMYKIISKCEELNKSLGFLDELRDRIKFIKQTLDQFEKIIM